MCVLVLGGLIVEHRLMLRLVATHGCAMTIGPPLPISTGQRGR